MKRMDRYLLGEMILPFVGGILLIVVMLVGNTLFPLIEIIVKNNIPLMVVTKLVVFNIPTLLMLTLPGVTALASAWAVNRMARDSEITAIRMSGVSAARLFTPIFIVGLVASIAAFYLGDRVVHAAQHEFHKTQGEMIAYSLQASPDVAANKVFTYQDYSFFIREIRKDPSGNPNKLQLLGVTLYQSPSGVNTFATETLAQTADYNHDIWTLHNVVTRTFDAQGYTKMEIGGKTLILNLQVPLSTLAENAINQPDELTLRELGTEMAALERTHQDDTVVAVNYYMKLSLPFVCLAFALCTPPLALRFARAGAYTGIFLSLVIVWIGWNTLLLTKFLGLSGKLSPLLAAWAPDMLFVVAGLYFLWRVE